MPIFDFLNPNIPGGLPTVVMPVIDATDSGLKGYGHLVDDPELCPVEIVRWPSTGTRPVDEDTGDEAGTTQGGEGGGEGLADTGGESVAETL